MKKKLNKKLLNLIVLCSGITATVAVGVGGIIYSVLEKNGGDEPVDPNVLPKSVYIIENNVLMGFTKEFLANPTAYDMCDTMQIPANVTSINGFAFYDDTEYKTTIPSFITKLTFADGSNCSSIGNDTFRSSSLTSVKLPSALITIQDSAFEECSALTSVDFSNAIKLTSIGEDAFTACIKLSSANLSNCAVLDSINGFAFGNCSTLSSVTLPSSLKIIGAQAFTYCGQLTSVNFSECTGLTQIKNSAFSHCPLSSTSVDLENAINLTSIGQQAFRSCNSLTSISLPSSLTSLSYNTFSDCPNLNSITWDAWDGNTSLVNSSFSRVSSKGTVVVTGSSEYDGVDLLQYLVNKGGLPESWLPAPELPGDVYIIENNVLKGFTTGFLANPSAYRLCDTMEIPANVTSIDYGAFCNDLESTIPSFITKLTFAEGSVCSTIGSYVFCSSPLTSITLPDSLTTIGDAAFALSKLTSVTLPNSLTTIGGAAFANCESLASVKFSRSLKTIGGCCFQNCPLLDNVELLNSRDLTSIGQQAFRGCSSLNLVSFPSSLESIGVLAFMDCSSLTSVILTNAINLKSIDESAFQSCTSLRSIDFTKPADLSYIGRGAFNGCSNLSSVVLPTNLETISNRCFAGCSSLTSVTFPSHLSRIGTYAFNGCSSLTSVSFPKDLLTVESSAFNDCSSLNSITWDAWNGNTNLQPTSFSGVCQTGGTVIVNNPSGHESDELLQYLLDNGGLPETWAKSVGPELPDSVYDIDENNVLKGFKAGIDLSQYDGICNTIQIPARVTNIDHNAFYKDSSTQTQIPSFITKLTFAKGSVCSTIGNSAFRKCSSLTSVDFLNCHNLSYCYPAVFSDCSSLTSVDFLNCTNLSGLSSSVFQNCTSLTSVSFPSSLSDLGAAVFCDCSNLSSITWNAWSGESSIGSKVFSGISSKGNIVVTNPIDDEHDASALLEYLQTTASTSEFPKTGWRAASPESVYDINDDGILEGFKKRIHL